MNNLGIDSDPDSLRAAVQAEIDRCRQQACGIARVIADYPVNSGHLLGERVFGSPAWFHGLDPQNRGSESTGLGTSKTAAKSTGGPWISRRDGEPSHSPKLQRARSKPPPEDQPRWNDTTVPRPYSKYVDPDCTRPKALYGGPRGKSAMFFDPKHPLSRCNVSNVTAANEQKLLVSRSAANTRGSPPRMREHTRELSLRAVALEAKQDTTRRLRHVAAAPAFGAGPSLPSKGNEPPTARPGGASRSRVASVVPCVKYLRSFSPKDTKGIDHRGVRERDPRPAATPTASWNS